MITKTFHDIYDLVKLVGTLYDSNIDIGFENGVTKFTITNCSDHDANGHPHKYERVDLGEGNLIITGYLENIDKAYRVVEQKIASGEWKKAEVPA